VIVRHYVLATAGHIDHGKSALVKALTGTDPDRLPEEKSRGITIDLGFAELSLTAGDGRRIHAGIVDVPGHEGFVRNMIAGVGSIDLALLVVGADDGWMPQTEEHFQILNYLDVKRMVVAITKCDAFDAKETITDVSDKLHETRHEKAPIVSISSLTGIGLDQLRETIVRQLGDLAPAKDIAKPRLFVDRAFTLRGVGTVVTGTLIGGSLQQGQHVAVQPAGIPSRIRSLQNHGQLIETAVPGNRTAINLADVSVGESDSTVRRGNVITLAEFHGAKAIDALLERSDRRLEAKQSAAAPLKHGASAYLHHGTSRIVARVFFLDAEKLSAGEGAIAQLRLKEPIVAFLGDRFVLRDQSNLSTIAGGRVLDPDSNQRNFRTASHRTLLANRAIHPDDIETAVLTQIVRDKAVVVTSASMKWPFSPGELQQTLQRLAQTDQLFLRGDFALDPQAWREWTEEVSRLVDQHHSSEPAARGLALRQLRAWWRPRPPAVLDLLLTELCQAGFERQGEAISRSSYRPSFPADLNGTSQRIIAMLSHKPFDPPGRRDLLALPHGREALSCLLEHGDILEISPDLVLLKKNFEQMQSAVRAFIAERGQATVSDLRKHLGTTRRVIVPFLEKLDSQRVTRRNGDHRTLANEKRNAKLDDVSDARQN
jgi:selenocysteine-specific elongation factor